MSKLFVTTILLIAAFYFTPSANAAENFFPDYNNIPRITKDTECWGVTYTGPPIGNPPTLTCRRVQIERNFFGGDPQCKVNWNQPVLDDTCKDAEQNGPRPQATKENPPIFKNATEALEARYGCYKPAEWVSNQCMRYLKEPNNFIDELRCGAEKQRKTVGQSECGTLITLQQPVLARPEAAMAAEAMSDCRMSPTGQLNIFNNNLFGSNKYIKDGMEIAAYVDGSLHNQITFTKTLPGRFDLNKYSAGQHHFKLVNPNTSKPYCDIADIQIKDILSRPPTPNESASSNLKIFVNNKSRGDALVFSPAELVQVSSRLYNHLNPNSDGCVTLEDEHEILYKLAGNVRFDGERKPNCLPHSLTLPSEPGTYKLEADFPGEGKFAETTSSLDLEVANIAKIPTTTIAHINGSSQPEEPAGTTSVNIGARIGEGNSDNCITDSVSLKLTKKLEYKDNQEIPVDQVIFSKNDAQNCRSYGPEGTDIQADFQLSGPGVYILEASFVPDGKTIHLASHSHAKLTIKSSGIENANITLKAGVENPAQAKAIHPSSGRNNPHGNVAGVQIAQGQNQRLSVLACATPADDPNDKNSIPEVRVIAQMDGTGEPFYAETLPNCQPFFISVPEGANFVAVTAENPPDPEFTHVEKEVTVDIDKTEPNTKSADINPDISLETNPLEVGPRDYEITLTAYSDIEDEDPIFEINHDGNNHDQAAETVTQNCADGTGVCSYSMNFNPTPGDYTIKFCVEGQCVEKQFSTERDDDILEEENTEVSYTLLSLATGEEFSLPAYDLFVPVSSQFRLVTYVGEERSEGEIINIIVEEEEENAAEPSVEPTPEASEESITEETEGSGENENQQCIEYPPDGFYIFLGGDPENWDNWEPC